MHALLSMVLLISAGCARNILNYDSGSVKISIQTGDEWLHEFPLFLGIKKDNPPQFAIWITDTDTNYLTTLFATHKVAHEGWYSNNGNRRRESLPFWAYNRGVLADDGLPYPTKDKPLIDGVSGATPKQDTEIKFEPAVTQFLIFAEFNHSVDYNEFFPEKATQEDSGFSGGDGGSGQPAVVYGGYIDLTRDSNVWELSLIGHSSPDGSVGELYRCLDHVSSARHIVKSVNVERR